MSATWYSSPTAATSGSGSSGDPWQIQIALTNGSIAPGDTLYLRGGTNIVSVLSSTISGAAGNYVVVQNYPGERVVIQDGAVGILKAALAATTNTVINAPVAGSELWPTVILLCGLENLYPIGRDGTNWNFIRGWSGTTISAHAINDAIRPLGNIIQHSGSYVRFQGFEITSPYTTNRVHGDADRLADGIDLLGGMGNKAVNLIVHDVGHPGIGFWEQGAGGEINGCIIYGCGEYYNSGTAIRGSAIYSQNASGLAIVKNCIAEYNFTGGGKVFGESGPVKDFKFIGNMVLQNALNPLSMNSGSTATSNTWMLGNYMTGTPSLSYASFYNNLEVFAGNVVVNGSFALTETTNSFLTNNTVFMPKNDPNGSHTFNYTSSVLNTNQMNIVWDYNTIYLGDGSGRFQWTFGAANLVTSNSADAGLLAFNNDSGRAWQDWSKFDAHTTYVQGWPTNYLNIQSFPLDYDSSRHHIVVVSTSGQTNVSIGLGTNGFGLGDLYTLRDAQNYFTVIASGAYTGAPLNLPLNLTNIAALQGNVTNFVPQHTDVANPGLFNVFVLDRTPGATMNVTTLNVSTKVQ